MTGLKRRLDEAPFPAAKRPHLALAKYRPSRTWIETCGTAVEIISQILAHTMGSKWTVIPQGSFVQGLQVAGSDLDVVLLDGTDRWKTMNRNRNADELESAVRKLTRAQWDGYPVRINVIRKIYRARVPLARLRVTIPSSQQQVEVDMCFGDPSRGMCDQFVYRIVSRINQLETFCLAMKIWANKRGLTETHTGGLSCFAVILVSIFFYRQSGLNLIDFFEFLISLRHKTRVSVSVETQQLLPRPGNGDRDLLHVAVPCRPSENAARCLTLSVWVNKVLPEIRRAIGLCKASPADRRTDMDFMVSQLVERATPVSFKSEDDAVSEASSESETVEFIPSVLEIQDSEYESSVDSERLISLFANQRSDSSVRLARKPATPVNILECDECNYFSFNKSDLQNHYYAVHGFARRKPADFPEVNRYRAPRRTTHKPRHIRKRHYR